MLVLDAAYAEYVQRNDYEAGIELVATSENVVMCRTFSKIHGLAAVRLGWLYGPGAHRRRAQPRAQPVQRQHAGDEGRHCRDRGLPRMSEASVAHNKKWLAWLSEEIGKLGLR